jgi:hypothetical protein
VGTSSITHKFKTVNYPHDNYAQLQGIDNAARSQSLKNRPRSVESSRTPFTISVPSRANFGMTIWRQR